MKGEKIYLLIYHKKNMDDTTISIIAILISAIVMFITPLVVIADRHDDIAQLSAQSVTAEFVNEVIRSGKITEDTYQKFVTGLHSSGNTYDINMEVKILDETTSKLVTDDNPEKIGNNSYYSLFTSQVEEKIGISSQNKINNKSGKLILKQGDIISVTVKNNSKTLSQTIKNFYFNETDDDLHIIVASSSGTITINGAI